MTNQTRTSSTFYDTVGSEKRKARSEAGALRTVGTQRPCGSTVVSTVQRVIAWVDASSETRKRRSQSCAGWNRVLPGLLESTYLRTIQSNPWKSRPVRAYQSHRPRSLLLLRTIGLTHGLKGFGIALSFGEHLQRFFSLVV